MKLIVQQMAAYNTWANELLCRVIASLPVETAAREVFSSFNTMQKTILHMADAESIWWQRMKLNEKINRPSENFFGDINDACSLLIQHNKQWQEWCNSVQERMLEHEFIYLNSKKEQFKQPVYQVLIHMFNHGTYHRGQLVTMLRQLGVEKIPATDFIEFTRKVKI